LRTFGRPLLSGARALPEMTLLPMEELEAPAGLRSREARFYKINWN
jgi:hypothetical protein